MTRIIIESVAANENFFKQGTSSGLWASSLGKGNVNF